MLKSAKQKNPQSYLPQPIFCATSPKWSPLVPSSFAGRSSVVINAGQSRIFWNFGMNISQNLPQFCAQTASMLCRCNLDELLPCNSYYIPNPNILRPFLLYGSKIGLQMRAGASPDFCESFTEEQKLSRARHYSENDKNNQKKLIKRFK